MQSIREPFERVLKRKQTLYPEIDLSIDEMIKNLEDFNSQPAPKHIQEIKKQSAKLSETAKEFQGLLGKCSKAVEKKFKSDLDEIWDPKALVGKDAIIQRILLTHFIREGRFDLAETFCKEANLELDAKLSNQFMEMFLISKALREENSDLAIEWAQKHSKELAASGSSFEFKLYQFRYVRKTYTRYLSLVKAFNIKGALAFAQAHFHKFSGKHMKGIFILTLEIQQLMCCILFAKRLLSSPYSHFADPYLASSLQTQFSREFSQLLGQSFESPLYTCVTVGSTALPMIMKLSTLMKDKSLEWSQSNELPVTLPLLETQRYHSTFVCPVTKEQGTEINPPMMMLCGHVLSKESLMRLAKGSMASRFKCPYCPVDSTASQAVRIYF